MHKDGQLMMSVRSVAGSLRLDLDRYDQSRYDHIHKTIYKRRSFPFTKLDPVDRNTYNIIQIHLIANP